MKTAPNTDIASTFLSRNIRLIRYTIFGYRSKSQRDYGAEAKWNIHFAQYSILSQFCRTESVYRIKQQHLSLTLQQCARARRRLPIADRLATCIRYDTSLISCDLGYSCCTVCALIMLSRQRKLLLYVSFSVFWTNLYGTSIS